MTANISIVIPTFGREQVLLDTILAVLTIVPKDTPILVIDQTLEHTPQVSEQLLRHVERKEIQHIILSPPSICKAMNFGIKNATSRYILYLDDDVLPDPNLIEAHLAALENHSAVIVAGRVIQPWQEGIDYSQATEFHFATVVPRYIGHFMGGNFSIDRNAALELGGFDENFTRVAYNFEAEFAYRWRRAGHKIYYEPAACIHHLKVASGGTRTYGQHLRTVRPDHSVGAYYFILRTWTGWSSLGELVWRPIRAISTRHHLTRPWWIPVTLLSEISGLFWAIWLTLRGPQLVRNCRRSSSVQRDE